MKVKFFNLGGKYLIHIILIVIGLFLFFYIGESFFNLSELNIIWMFVFWFVAVYISDRLAHIIIGEE